jgi:hypothetical protein
VLSSSTADGYYIKWLNVGAAHTAGEAPVMILMCVYLFCTIHGFLCLPTSLLVSSLKRSGLRLVSMSSHKHRRLTRMFICEWCERPKKHIPGT